MKRRILYWILMVALTLILAGPQAMAKGKGKNSDAGTHSGWEKGKKKGWGEGNVPPGYDKEATGAIDEEAEEDAKKMRKETKERSRKTKKKLIKSKERAEEEGENAEKSVEREREKAGESEKD